MGLNFCQIDLEHISDIAKKGLSREAAFFCSPSLGTFDDDSFFRRLGEGKGTILTERAEQRIRVIQQGLRPILGWIHSNMQVHDKGGHARDYR